MKFKCFKIYIKTLIYAIQNSVSHYLLYITESKAYDSKIVSQNFDITSYFRVIDD
jgi:hypothetical protein